MQNESQSLFGQRLGNSLIVDISFGFVSYKYSLYINSLNASQTPADETIAIFCPKRPTPQ